MMLNNLILKIFGNEVGSKDNGGLHVESTEQKTHNWFQVKPSERVMRLMKSLSRKNRNLPKVKVDMVDIRIEPRYIALIPPQIGCLTLTFGNLSEDDVRKLVEEYIPPNVPGYLRIFQPSDTAIAKYYADVIIGHSTNLTVGVLSEIYAQVRSTYGLNHDDTIKKLTVILALIDDIITFGDH